VFTRGISRRELLKSSVQIGMSAGWFASPVFAQEGEATSTDPDPGLQALIQQWAEPLPPIEDPNFARFIDRHRGAKVVLLGESTHGTDEFYRARAAITERLVREHGFNIVAVEADWPDAARIDSWIRNYADLPAAVTPFQRFPIWMWRNRAVRDLVDRLHAINARRDAPDDKVGFFGLDLYSLPSSMDAVMDFAKHHDPETLKEVQERYGCLAPYKDNLQAYGATARQGGPNPVRRRPYRWWTNC
jgi:erythromycin esterase-like protein